MNSTNPMSNGTCHKTLAQDSPSLFQNGKLVLQTYHIGWIIAGSFAIASTITSLWLINKHLRWYTYKREQRYIIRILFMVPLYALVSFVSFLFWNHSTPLLLVRDAYEATVLTAFFYLLLVYLSPDVEEQKSVFIKLGLSLEADNVARRNGQEVKKWIFPLGFVNWKPTDGLYFLQLMKWGVLQYCVIRPSTTLIAVILDYMGLFCEESWGLGWGHIYITTIVSISVTIAMYCLIQLYVPVRANLAPHKPLLKLFAIKAVVFLTFWQGTLLSMLGMLGVVKDTKYMTAADINIGIGSLLETFEMMLFAFLHLRAFTYKPYRSGFSDQTPRLRSLGHAMDFRETFREIWSGWLYVIHTIRGKEPTSDMGAKRTAHFKEAFGRPRAPASLNTKMSERKSEPDFPVEVEVEEQVFVDIGGEKQWLGLGDNYGYGLQYFRRERSDGLEIQIGRELERRGYTPHTPGGPAIDTQAPPRAEELTGQGRQHSWWSSIYDRISQSSQESQWGPGLNQPPVQSRRPSKSRRQRPLTRREASLGLLSPHGHDLDDPPPPSVIRTHHNQHRSNRGLINTGEDVLTPLPVLDKRKPKNLPSQRVFKNSAPGSKHVKAPAAHYPAGSGVRDSSSRYSAPVQAPTQMDAFFGRVFQSNSSSSHGTSDFDSTHPALEESSRSRSTPTIPMSPVQDYEFGVARERFLSQTQFRFHTAPDGLTAEVVTFPSLESHHEMSNFSRSDSWHRREAAFLHPPFSSLSAQLLHSHQ